MPLVGRCAHCSGSETWPHKALRLCKSLGGGAVFSHNVVSQTALGSHCSSLAASNPCRAVFLQCCCWEQLTKGLALTCTKGNNSAASRTQQLTGQHLVFLKGFGDLCGISSASVSSCTCFLQHHVVIKHILGEAGVIFPCVCKTLEEGQPVSH